MFRVAVPIIGLTLAAGPATAQGVALLGEARLGLGYNIDNDGDPTGEDEARAISRVRFGVVLTGETAGGIAFGAEAFADEAIGAESGTEGAVFVSGALGTLTYGDTEGADAQWVGDVPGNLSLTGLGDLNETPFISNGGDFGEDTGPAFLENPAARPTLRYDLEMADGGLSLSSNRDLTDLQVGAGYSVEFAGGAWNLGVGYSRFAAFEFIKDSGGVELVEGGLGRDLNGDGDVGDALSVPAEETVAVPAGTQWSAGFIAEYEDGELGVVYSSADADGGSAFETIAVGGALGWDALTVGAYYSAVLGAEGGLVALNGDDSYGVSAEYDLGGGAALKGGIARTFGFLTGSAETVADFGIELAF